MYFFCFLIGYKQHSILTWPLPALFYSVATFPQFAAQTMLPQSWCSSTFSHSLQFKLWHTMVQQEMTLFKFLPQDNKKHQEEQAPGPAPQTAAVPQAALNAFCQSHTCIPTEAESKRGHNFCLKTGASQNMPRGRV